MVTKKLTIVVEADDVNFSIVKIIEALDYKNVKFISFTEEEINK